MKFQRPAHDHRDRDTDANELPQQLRAAPERLSASRRVSMGEYRTKLADWLGGDAVLTVMNRGSVAGYWLPASAVPSTAQLAREQAQAQLQASVALDMLARVTTSESIARELAELEAHREAGGLI